MNILRFHHGQVSILKGAEDQAREFYCNFLGLKEIEKPDSLKSRGGFWLQLGDTQMIQEDVTWEEMVNLVERFGLGSMDAMILKGSLCLGMKIILASHSIGQSSQET